jgi:glycosyltransferase involved in cell wall biosynthesis
MCPIIGAINAKYIVEIGADRGMNTRNILEYCIKNDAHMTAVDPFPNFDIDKFKAEYGDKFEIFTELSLNRLPLLEDYDVILVDGDHNWYTVYNELKIIEKNFANKKFPLIFLHDIGWPYAKRDLYYNPENIPETYRQHYKKLGILPGHPDLQEEGGLNVDLNNAIYENNPKNGVLTAIEDFIDESKLDFSFIPINALFGLGILYPKNKKLDNIVKNVMENIDLVDLLEKERIEMVIARSNLRTQMNNLTDKNNKHLKQLNHLEVEMEKLRTAYEKSKTLIKLFEKQLEEANEKNWKYKSKLDYLESRLEEKTYEMDFITHKNRSIHQRLISRFPSLYMFVKIPKTGLKTILINRKGYQAIKSRNLLDIGYYLQNNPDVLSKGDDPIIHYIYHGFEEGRNPNHTFNGKSYLDSHNDVKMSNINPLVHYALYGVNEKRNHDITGVDLDFNKEPEGNIKGEIKFNRNNLLLTGFLAIIGINSPREAIIKIDDKKFNIKCDEFRLDLKKNRVNQGYHAFTLNVPPQFIDGEKHTLRLFDKKTGELIVSYKTAFSQPRRYRDLSGYLGNSLVSPIVYAPFREQDKRCFATMENITKYLSNLVKEQTDYPMVSVIMPVYNSIETLQAAIDSVLTQTYDNIEIVIVDGGSNDGSFEFLKEIEDENIIIIQNPECKENSKARNLGLTAVHGKYITYLDSDNTWDSKYIAAMVGAFYELPDADAIYSGQLLFMEDQENPFAVRFGSLNRSLLENRNYIDLNSFSHTHDLYKQLGGFDESLGLYTDWDWILQISNKAQIYSIPVLLTNFNCTDDKIKNNDPDGHFLNLLRKKQFERQQTNQDTSSFQIPENNSVSIIIPSYESLNDIRECLESIFKLNASEWLETIVVDNASSQPVIDYLSELAGEDKIKFIKNDINYGFTYAVNQGIGAAKPGNDIVLMNNDAMITPSAVEAMQKAAYSLPDCGIVVPQQVLPGGSKTLVEHVPFANSEYECDVNISWLFENMINMPLFHSGRFVELNFAPFFCVYIKHDVLNSSVGLDAEFGRHYRSDRIFCNYIRHAMNLKIYHVNDAVVYHKLQKSTDILRERSQDDFDIMFTKNQWDDGLASQFGYKKPLWDF